MKDAESEEPGRHPNEEKGLPEDRQLSGKKLNTLKEEFDAMLAQMQAPGSREAMMGASMLRHRRYGRAAVEFAMREKLNAPGSSRQTL
jgi:hypothetical protein